MRLESLATRGVSSNVGDERAAFYCFRRVIYSSYPSTGINDSDMDDADVCANDAKRIKRNVS